MQSALRYVTSTLHGINAKDVEIWNYTMQTFCHKTTFPHRIIFAACASFLVLFCVARIRTSHDQNCAHHRHSWDCSVSGMFTHHDLNCEHHHLWSFSVPDMRTEHDPNCEHRLWSRLFSSDLSRSEHLKPICNRPELLCRRIRQSSRHVPGQNARQDTQA